MRILDHATQSSEDWRKGVRTQMQVSALTGSMQLTVFEQWCDPGMGAPTHLHAVEEVLTLLEGEAEIWVEKEKIIGTKWKSVLIPPGYWHGFRNIGQGTLHMRAILAAPIFEASYEDRTEVGRRWVPEHKPA
ncbi:MAG: cupin domain-containing protein [Hyphomicrobiales bacterium]